jgi:hypothetical protein
MPDVLVPVLLKVEQLLTVADSEQSEHLQLCTHSH